MSTSRGYTLYWYNLRFLNWGPGPELYGQGLCTNTRFIRGRYVPKTLHYALTGGRLADPVPLVHDR